MNSLLDCGKEVVVDAWDMKTKRCQECTDKYNKEYNKDYMREYMRKRRANKRC